MAGIVDAIDRIAAAHCHHRWRCFFGQSALWSAAIFVAYEVAGAHSSLRPLLGFCLTGLLR
jgi:hypothetical protein